MKTNSVFVVLLTLLLSLMFNACEMWEPYEPYTPSEEPGVVESGSIIMRMASGYNSQSGKMYIQKGVSTWMSVKEKTTKKLKLVTWEIEGKKFFGQEIIYKTDKLGVIAILITAEYEDGTSIESEFELTSVYDISEFDPVKAFVLSGGNALILVSKERIANAINKNFFYVGTATEWINRPVPIADHNYVITSGQPVAVTDVGKYIGIRFKMEVGENKLALIYTDKYAENVWADLSGSQFIKIQDNPGLIIFDYNGAEIIPLGDNQAELPGVNGDTYFRFSKREGVIDIYFRFDANISAKSFFVKRTDNGTYSAPVTVNPVTDFPEWGTISLPWTDVENKVLHLRAGENKDTPNVFSENMKKSRFYTDFYNALVLSAAEF